MLATTKGFIMFKRGVVYKAKYGNGVYLSFRGAVFYYSELESSWVKASITDESDLIRWFGTGTIMPLVEDEAILEPRIKDAKISWEMTTGVIKSGNGAENRMLIGSANKDSSADKTNKDDSRVELNAKNSRLICLAFRMHCCKMPWTPALAVISKCNL